MINKATSKARGWRTFAVNAALGAVPAIEIVGTLVNMPELRGIIPSQYMPYYGLAVALINVYLRTITKTPAGKRQ